MCWEYTVFDIQIMVLIGIVSTTTTTTTTNTTSASTGGIYKRQVQSAYTYFFLGMEFETFMHALYSLSQSY